MAFSDAFLRGKAISEQEKEDQLAGVKAILGRSGRRGSAVGSWAPSRVVGGGDPLARVNQASARVATEERQEEADQMAKEKHAAVMEQAELGNEMLRRELATMPSEEESLRDRHERETMEAYDRSLAAESAVGTTALAEAVVADTMDTQRRNRYRRDLSDAWQMRNADAMNKAVRGAFPGMESKHRVTGEAGRAISEAAGADAYPVFSDDGEGNIYVRWPGSETSVPVTRGDVRQLIYASSPGLEAPTAGKKAGTAAGVAATDTKESGVSSGMSAKDKAKYIVDQQKANNDTYKTAIDFANSMTGGDQLMGEAADPQAWLQAFNQGLDMMSKKEVQEQIFGLQPTRPPMKRRATDKLIKGLNDRFDTALENGEFPETEAKQRTNEIAATLRQNFGWEAEKQWLQSRSWQGIPEGLNAVAKYTDEKGKVVTGTTPEAVPDLGTGVENVLHYTDGDIGMVVDKKLGHVKFWNKKSERWEPASQSLIRSFSDILRVKLKMDGQESVRPMLEQLNKKLKGMAGTVNLSGRSFNMFGEGDVETETAEEPFSGTGGAGGQF